MYMFNGVGGRGSGWTGMDAVDAATCDLDA
jgi:hypothetical protein